jgi:glycosyltransferase involved in cell wall biosynthesis
VSLVFSAIIPTYNRAALVGQAIESALAQRFPNGGDVEVIVVDDDSQDATAEIAAGFGARIRYIRQANRREGAARNTGAASAHATFFAFLDSDDYWLPGKLAGDLARFEQPDHPALVYSRGRNVDPADNPIGERRLASPQGDVFWLARRSCR